MSARRNARRRGATMVVMCILLPVVLALASFCVNVVFMEMTRTDLQIATDVATRAAGRTLAVTGSKDKATEAAKRMLSENPVANQVLPISAVDIVFGVSTRSSTDERYLFTTDANNPNAVKVMSNGSHKPQMLFPTMGMPVDFRPIKNAISTQLELDIALVLDRSGSMAFGSNEPASALAPAAAPAGWAFGDPVPVPSRWMDTNIAVQKFLGVLSKSALPERLALSTYGSKATTDVALTANYGDVQLALHHYSSSFRGGATDIGGGMLAGLATLNDKKLARPWASRVMILLSDGRHNTGVDPILSANHVAAADVQIYTISFSAEADTALMQTIAEIGAGKHFHAATGAELSEVFNEIAHGLPTLITL